MAGLKVYDGTVWKALGAEDSQWDVLTVVPTAENVNLNWPAAGGSPLSYEISVDDSIINVGNVTSYQKTGLNMFQDYEFKVRPVYSDSVVGGWSYFKINGPKGWNEATGGSFVDVSNYNSSSQNWRIHTFTSTNTFSVTKAYEPFRIFLVGGGANGTGGSCCYWGGAGGSGGRVYDQNGYLPVSNLTATVAGSGGNGTIHTFSSANGVNGGSGTGNASNGTNGASGGVGIISDITGTSVRYAGGGGGGANMASNCAGGGGGAGGAGGGGGGAGIPGGCNCCTYSPAGSGGAGTANTGGGGGGGAVYAQGCCSGATYGSGGAGGSGIIRIAYRIS